MRVIVYVVILVCLLSGYLHAVSIADSVIVDSNDHLKIIFLGDLMFDRGISKIINEKGPDYLFSETKEYLTKSDLVVANLESPLSKQKKINSLMTFGADPNLSKILKENNIKLVSIANNHILDITKKGFLEMSGYLKKSGINYIGADLDKQNIWEPYIFKIKNYKIAFLSYTDDKYLPKNNINQDIKIATMNILKMQKSIKKSKEKADYVVVIMHAGEEYSNNITAQQKEFARMAIDNGADIVIGHHPHVIQKVERYKGRYIFYSLGNFVFDQKKKETKTGMIVTLRINKNEAIGEKISVKFIEQKDYSPVFVEAGKEKKLSKKLECKTENLFLLNYMNKKIEINKEIGFFMESRERRIDLDDMKIVFKQAKVYVYKLDKQIWQSQDRWTVLKVLTGDINNDGKKEFSLLVLKDRKDIKVRNNNIDPTTYHLYIFAIKDGKVIPKWWSSEFRYKVIDCTMGDLNKDGKIEFFTIDEDDKGTRLVTEWFWQDWVLTKIKSDKID